LQGALGIGRKGVARRHLQALFQGAHLLSQCRF
jgi:hypothetical protein